MDMSLDKDVQTASISKGCFLFKGSHEVKGRKKRSRSVSGYGSESTHALVQECAYESSDQRQIRVDMMKSCWDAFETQIDEIQSHLHNEIIDSVVNFVRESYSFSLSSDEFTMLKEIPTAALLTGVNLPDHGVVFKELASRLKCHVSSFISQIRSADCANFRLMLRAALCGLVSAKSNDESVCCSKGEYDSDSDVDVKKSDSPFRDYTLREFVDWYQLHRSNSIDSDASLPPVVFILEGFESFPMNVLQDFILCCAECIPKVPVVLVLGVATTMAAVQRSLPHAVSTKLAIQVFQSLPPLNCLTNIIDEVFLKGASAFKLGPKVLRLLYEQFLYHDFSISNFVRSVKFSVMQHFYSNPLCILCHHDEEEIRSFFASAGLEHLLRFAHIPSVAAYADKKSQEEQRKLTSDVKYIRNTYVSLILGLWKAEASFFPAIRCLFSVLSKLPKQPFGKRLRDVYEKCTDKVNVTKEKAYETAMALTRLLSRDELLSCLREVIQIFTTARGGGGLTFRDEIIALEGFCSSFQNLDANSVDGEVIQKANLSERVTFKSRHEFTESLKAGVKEMKKESPYEKLRCEIVDCLDAIFKKYLVSPMSLSFHEIYYFNDYACVQRHMNGVPRMALQNGLLSPWTYLRCNCCSGMGEGVQATLPDICILYQLHLECGRLINLYDWLQAFVAIVTSKGSATPSKKAGSRKKNAADKQKLDDQLQARFIRGVSELQFMGFIKPTKRKTDHVQRLTWGGC